MLDELKNYLLATRIRLEKKEREDLPIDLLMCEISKIAIENWLDEKDPQLTNEQLLVASRRVIAQIYNRN